MIYFSSKDKEKIKEFVEFLDERVPVYKKFVVKMFAPVGGEFTVTEDSWASFREFLLERDRLKLLIEHVTEKLTLEEAKALVDSCDETLKIREEL